MEIQEILQRIQRIEIKTRGLTKQMFSGQYQAAFKGTGMTFSEVRPYAHGDEVRTIDWNVTARFNEPFVKVFEEERELSVMLLIDVSPSTLIGSGDKNKRLLSVEIAAVLAFSAIANQDKVGALFVSDQVELYIPPKKGKKHAMYLLRQLIDFHAKGKRTQLEIGLEYLSKVEKKRSVLFVISDFQQDTLNESVWHFVRKKQDIIALQLVDPIDWQIPSLGLVQIRDAESGESRWVDSQGNAMKQWIEEQQHNLNENKTQFFRKLAIDFASFNTKNDFILPLIHLFQARNK